MIYLIFSSEKINWEIISSKKIILVSSGFLYIASTRMEIKNKGTNLITKNDFKLNFTNIYP